MRKPSIGSALTSSLRAEQEAVDQRFADLSQRADRADQALQVKRPVNSDLAVSSVMPANAFERPDGGRLDKESEEDFGSSQGGVVRANFSMPLTDYDLISQLRERCSRNGVILSRSEILRAGLHALLSLSLPQLLQIAQAIEHLKPGPVKRKRRLG